MNILLVEDSEAFGETVQEALNMRGHAVTWAKTIAEAVEVWNAARPSTSHGPRLFDVILCDYELPEYEGGLNTGKGTEFLSRVLANTEKDDAPPEVILWSGLPRLREAQEELPGQAHRVTLFEKEYLPEVLDYIHAIGDTL